MPDMQQACVKVDIGVGESQKLPGPQSGKIQKAQGSAENCVSHWRCLSSRQFDGSLQETFAFVSAEHARHKFPAHNSQGRPSGTTVRASSRRTKRQTSRM